MVGNFRSGFGRLSLVSALALALGTVALALPEAPGARTACRDGECDFYLVGGAIVKGTCTTLEYECGCAYSDSVQTQSDCNRIIIVE